MTVRVGEHDLENPNPDMIEFGVEFFILHEDYGGGGSSGSDIVLVKVSHSCFFFKKMEDISCFCGVSDISVLDFW